MNNTTFTKKLPPYGGKVKIALSLPDYWNLYAGTSATGSGVSISVICGSNGWEKAKALSRKHLFVLLPHEHAPSEYDWSLLAGHDPVRAIVAGDPLTDEQYSDLAAALMRDGVTRFLRPRGAGRIARHLSSEVIKCTAK